MAKNVKIEKIEAAETEIDRMNTEEGKMRKLYLSDGVIDDTEQQALDRIKGKITKLSDAVAKLRAEVEENKRIFESRSGDWDTLKSQLDDLKSFGHAEAATLRGVIGEIDTCVTDQRWADGTAAIDQAMVSMGPVWDDYLVQTEAQAKYEPLRADIDTRIAAARVAEPAVESFTAPLANIENNIPAVDASVDSRNYVEALEVLKLIDTELQAVEVEIARIVALKIAYEATLAALQPRIAEASVSEFQKLAERQTELLAIQDAMEAAAALHDYETAQAKADELGAALDAYLPEQDELRAQRDEFESAYGKLKPRLSAASTSELESTAGIQQTIIDLQDKIDTAAAAEEYSDAMPLLGELDTALTEYETIMEDRDLYEARLAAMQDELAEASVSQAKWAYLEPIQSDLMTIQGEMETAAAAEDYETALIKIAELEAKLGDFFATIEAKKAEYEAARGPLEPRLAHLDECNYPLAAEKTAVKNALKDIDKAVTEEDWESALNGMATAEAALSAFDTAHKTHDDQIRVEVTTKLVGIKAVIAGNVFSTSSTKKSLVKLVAEIDAALSKTSDLDSLPNKVKLADDLSKDLEVINQINARIDDKWDINKDNEALAIVNELKSDPAKLADLPFEARNRLIDEMLDGSTNEDEQKAVQDLWASTKDTIDPAFEAQDAKLTGKMLKALEDDPKVQEYAKNWSGMNNADKQKAMKHIGGIIGGDDGYELDGIEDIDFTADGKRGSTDCTTKPGLRGFHAEAHGDKPEEISVCMCNTYTLSNGSKWDPGTDMGDVLMNLTHEVGHGYQEQLIDKLECGDLKPGDAEYEQARALQLDRKYFKKFPDDYEGSTYINSPFEQLSRITANRVGSDLPPGYGTGYTQEL